MIPVLGGEVVKEVGSASRSSTGQVTAWSYLAPYLSADVTIAASAVVRSGAFQISRRSGLAAGWMDLGSWSSTLAVLCTLQR